MNLILVGSWLPAKSASPWPPGRRWHFIATPRDHSLRPINIDSTLDTLLAGEKGMCICLIQRVGEENIAPLFSTGGCCEQPPWGRAMAEPAAPVQGEPAADVETQYPITVAALVRAKYTPTRKELH